MNILQRVWRIFEDLEMAKYDPAAIATPQGKTIAYNVDGVTHVYVMKLGFGARCSLKTISSNGDESDRGFSVDEAYAELQKIRREHEGDPKAPVPSYVTRQSWERPRVMHAGQI